MGDRTIFLAGGNGFLGRKVGFDLHSRGYDVVSPRHEAYDFRYADQSMEAIGRASPAMVINMAADVGGIEYNRTRPVELFVNNILPGINLLNAAQRCDVGKFVQIGSVCEYPKFAPCPIREESLWDGYPEETNAPYGIAKRAIFELGRAYRAEYGMNVIHLLLSNLYGPGCDISNNSHVIPSLIRKFLVNDGKVTIWGTGKPTRDFLYVGDAMEAVNYFALNYDQPEPVNCGTGTSISIGELANKIAHLTGFMGKIEFDASKPDGQPNRMLDVSRANRLGWKSQANLDDGLAETIEYCKTMITKEIN